MNQAFTFKQIEEHLIQDFRDRTSLHASYNTEEELETGALGCLTMGPLDDAFALSSPAPIALRKVVGVLFADRNIKFVQDRVIPDLEYLHHRTGDHLEIFCAGYNAYVPEDDSPKDNQLVRPNINGDPWKFSTLAFLEVEKKLEEMSTWERKDGCSLVLFSVIVTKDSVKYDFENCLDWNLITMIETDKAITSVRALVHTVVKVIEKKGGTWEASDKFAVELIKEAIKDSVLALVPKTIGEKYRKAEHFAVKNYKKKAK